MAVFAYLRCLLRRQVRCLSFSPVCRLTCNWYNSYQLSVVATVIGVDPVTPENHHRGVRCQEMCFLGLLGMWDFQADCLFMGCVCGWWKNTDV